MNYLKTAPFGGLFAVTFTVVAAFQITMSLLGLILVFISPGLFKMNGAAAANPVQAAGVLVYLLVFGLFMNAGMSALGSAIWLGVRRFLPAKA
jgi:ABC-type siderophore export system fused ATPase/permease subunit